MDKHEQQQRIQQAQKIVSAGKIQLMEFANTAFFAVIMLNLKETYTFDRVPTAGVNANMEIFYNPNFILNTIKTKEQMKFLLMHEIMHIVLAHTLKSRRQGRDPKKWNVAGDHVINLELKESGFAVLDCALADPKYKGMNTEEVYDLLPDEPDSHMDDLMDPDDGDGESSESSSSSSSGQSQMSSAAVSAAQAERDAEAEQKIKDVVLGAHLQHQMQQQDGGSRPGKLPASIERLINKWLNPTLPWQQILARFLNNVNKEDYSWRHLNRRMYSLGYYMPTLHSEHMDRLDFAIDVSGSINAEEFQTFLSEIVGILKRFTPKEMGVMQFDTYTRTTNVISSVNELARIPYAGGGGTCIRDTLAEFEKSPAKALIIFTDGHLRLDLIKPSRPVVWCIYDNKSFKAPFGEVIHFNLKDLKKRHS